MFGQERSKIEPEWCRKNKNILRTSEAENGYFFKNAQPGLEKCGSYIKKSVPRPAPSKSFRTRKRPFFIEFDENVTDRRTHGPTNQPTDGQGRL